MTTMYTGDKGNMWSGMPVENIARIDIIRGLGSALYGADAYAGIINIITKTSGDVAGTRAGGLIGSFNTRGAWVQHGEMLGEFDTEVYLRVGRTDGIKEIITKDAQSRNDVLFGTAASHAPGPVSTDYDSVDAGIDLSHWKWRWLSGYMLRDNLGPGAGTKLSYLNYLERSSNDLVLLPAGARLPAGTFPDGMIGGPNRWERQMRLSAFVT